MVAIIGAGMAGLLAGAMFRGDGQIYEAAESLPNNHHALLRFRKDEIGQYLNIPFQKVDVIKIVKPWRNAVADAVAYSMKCTGKATFRSSVTADGKLVRRYIADPDFISELERHQTNEIIFGAKVDEEWLGSMASKRETIISTMPMPVLMDLLDYDRKPEFRSCAGAVIKVNLTLDSDICATIYYPEPAFSPSRATLTGNLLQIEIPIPRDGDNVDTVIESWSDLAGPCLNTFIRPILDDFGLDVSGQISWSVHKQKYSKILPIDEHERKRFIVWATDMRGVYSLGRFATWRPGLLLDDAFQDVQHIQQMIKNSNYYRRMK
jgi:hypothetical protein